MTDATADTGQIETRDDLGAPPKADARYWILQLKIQDKAEDKWRKRAQKVSDLYADNSRANETQNRPRAIKFNILYTNVETKKGALLPTLPKPDIRERWRTKDPVATTAADMVERCVAVLLERHDWEAVAKGAVLDRCLSGRAVVRVDYDVQTEDGADGNPQRITLQDVTPRQVQWKDFRRGPGKTWAENTWVAFRHELRREQLTSMFGEKIGQAVPLNLAPDERDVPKDADPNLWKLGEVWEIHDREKRQVVWICTDYIEAPLKVEEDKLGLEEFFPIPRPLLAISRPDSQEPIEEFRQYEDQARELEKVTRRIDKIIGALKVRGIAIGAIPEFTKVASADDNQIVQAQSDTTMAALANGKLGDAVWMWPLETAVKVLEQLYVQRDAIKQTIYEIDGIGDILRGAVDPREKLGQSQLKASWGSRRLDMQREEVQRFLRDVIRLMAEIVAEHFDPQQLMMMSGIMLPTAAQKAQAQQAAQQGAQLPPEIMKALDGPSIEDVVGVLRSDALRRFRVDVETDQSIAGDEQAEKQLMNEFLAGSAQYWTAFAPLIQGGFPKNVAVGLYAAGTRRFNLGRDVDEALEDLDDAPVPPPQPEQGDAGAAAQAQAKQVETDGKLKIMQADEAGKVAEHQRNIALKDKDLAIREIDRQIAELNAKVKTGEILVPPEAPEPVDEEARKADLRMKGAQAMKLEREAESVGAQTAETQTSADAVTIATQQSQQIAETLQQVLQMVSQMQQSQAQAEATLVRALTAKKRGRKMPDGSFEMETDMGPVDGSRMN